MVAQLSAKKPRLESWAARFALFDHVAALDEQLVEARRRQRVGTTAGEAGRAVDDQRRSQIVAADHLIARRRHRPPRRDDLASKLAVLRQRPLVLEDQAAFAFEAGPNLAAV